MYRISKQINRQMVFACPDSRKQSLVSIANLAASFTIVLTEIYIMLAVFRFIYQADFGERWQWLMIVTALGSLCAILLGTLVGNLIPK